LSGKKDIDTGRLVYTCNCGWIDTGHANPGKSRRPYIGAVALWEQIEKENGRRSKDANGFLVQYRQDMRTLIFGVGEDGMYFVQYGLTRAQKESVALAIFIEISLRFENMQASFPYNLGTDSGFSQEDLVSNLVGFYLAIRPGKDYMQLCKPVSIEESHKIWERYGSVGSHKNRSFTPVLHPCDACKKKPAFPQELQAIHPAVKGRFYRNWEPKDFGITRILLM